MRISSEITFAALLLTLVATVPFTAKPAAALMSLPVKTTLSIPFSGTFTSNLEAISIKGTLHVETDVTLTRSAMFAKVRANITDATAVGIKSGQKFTGLAAALKTCALPISDRDYKPVSLRLAPHYEVRLAGPVSPLYQGARKQSLSVQIPLHLQLKFQPNGALSAATASVGVATGSKTAPTRKR